MSRIGKKPIQIPAGVEVKVEGNSVSIKGPKGQLNLTVRPEIRVELKDGFITLSPAKETKKTGGYWGLFRTLIFNIIEGVVRGHEKKLEIQGVGYRANIESGDLNLIVGFSHPVKIKKPEGITFGVEKNIITINGSDKELVGQMAAMIRKVKKPEPYKGKGIRYVGEVVRKKVGKKAAGAEI